MQWASLSRQQKWDLLCNGYYPETWGLWRRLVGFAPLVLAYLVLAPLLVPLWLVVVLAARWQRRRQGAAAAES